MNLPSALSTQHSALARAAEPTLVYCPHPLLAAANRRLEYSTFLKGESIQGYLDRLGIRFGAQPVILWLNDRRIAREEWPLTFPKQGDLLVIRARVQGDNALRTVLTIVVIMAAYYFGGPAGGGVAMGLTAGEAAVGSALILVGGMALVNAIAPLPQPNLTNANGRLDDASPTYSLTGGSNRARAFGPLPIVMGQHRMFPDIGARPYTEFQGDAQVLFQVFNFGLSDIVLSDYRIGNTPLADFTGVTLEESGADGKLTLFPANVDTVAGGALTYAAGYITRVSSTLATALAIEVSGNLFYIDAGGITPNQADIEMEYRLAGAGGWTPLAFESDAAPQSSPVNGVARLPAEDFNSGVRRAITQQPTNITGVTILHASGDCPTGSTGILSWNPQSSSNDETTMRWTPPGGQPGESITIPEFIAAPRRWTVYGPNNSQSIVIEIATRSGTPITPKSDNNIGIGSIIGGKVTLFSASRKPLRRTYFFSVASGQYEVRVRRTSADDTDVRAASDLAWSQLRTYQPDTADYTGQKRVAVKITASGQLQGVLDQLSAIASARCEAWTGSAWVLQETSNPAWWWRAFAKGKRISGRRAFGCDLADTRIEEGGIKAFGAWCTSKGLTFNGVLDRPMSCEETLNAIARCGRGSSSRATGKHGVIWDAPDMPIVQVFGMGNIKLDSFRCSWVSEKLADEIELAFVNPDLDWQQDTVRALVPGVTDPVNTARVELFGCTDKDMAGHEANLIAAAQRYRRRTVSFESDFEGAVPIRGDVVMVAHDLFAMSQANAWGFSGRLVAGTTTQLTLDREVPFTVGQSHYAAVRFPDGNLYVRAVDIQVGESSVITLGSALPSAPNSDSNNPVVDYLWFFGLSADGPSKKMKVHDIAPTAPDSVRLILVDENPAYYASEDGDFGYTPPARFTAQFPVLSGLVVTEELIRAGLGFAVKLTLTWDVSGVYDHANVRIGMSEMPQEIAGLTHGRRFETVVAAEGVADIEVTGIHPVFGAGPQSKLTKSYRILGKATPPADVTGFSGSFDGPDTVLRWTRVPDVDVGEYEVRSGTDWNSAVIVGRSKSDVLRTAALAAPTTFWVKAFDVSAPANESITAASVTVSPSAPGQVVPSAMFEGGDVKLTWPAPAAGSYPVARYEVRHGATWAGGTPVGFVDVTTFRALANWSGSRIWWIAGLDVVGRAGTPGSIEVVVTKPSAPAITSEVIDNNVLLRWTDATQTLPIKHYEIRRGATFAGASVFSTAQARFANLFESSAGLFTYWVVGVDSAGNYGTEQSVAVSVSAPPDFILYDQVESSFAGTKTNCFIIPETGKLLATVNTTETFGEHFDNHSWASMQDQVDAGFPIYIEPSTTTGKYEEEIDLGAVIPSTLISVSMASSVVVGSVTVTPTVSHKKLSGDAWTDHAGVWQAYATDFQYVKVTLDFSSSGGNDLLLVDSLTTRLDVKIRRDSETVTANSGDSGGTTVNFNVAFIDVRAINGTAQGTTPANVVIDFTDAPNPTSFKVLVFDLAGNRITRDVRWEASGV